MANVAIPEDVFKNRIASGYIEELQNEAYDLGVDSALIITLGYLGKMQMVCARKLHGFRMQQNGFL